MKKHNILLFIRKYNSITFLVQWKLRNKQEYESCYFKLRSLQKIVQIVRISIFTRQIYRIIGYYVLSVRFWAANKMHA